MANQQPQLSPGDTLRKMRREIGAMLTANPSNAGEPVRLADAGAYRASWNAVAQCIGAKSTFPPDLGMPMVATAQALDELLARSRSMSPRSSGSLSGFEDGGTVVTAIRSVPWWVWALIISGGLYLAWRK